MQLHHLLIVNQTILCLKNNSQHSIEEFKPVNKDIINGLSEYLTQKQIPAGTGINLILDQQYIRYHYFYLPYIPKRKVRQILQFELDDTLLKGSADYHFNFTIRSQKGTETTESGVYAIEKSILDNLVALFREFNLELRCLSSLENLLDLSLAENNIPENQIHVEICPGHQQAKLFIYRNSFLIGVSAVRGLLPSQTTSNDIDALPLIDQINQKTGTIKLAEPDISLISLNNSFAEGLSIHSEGELIATDNYQPSIHPTLDEIQNFYSSIRPDHPKRINLINTNIFLFQELKKHTRPLALTVGILFLSLIIYSAAMLYGSFYDQRYFEHLESMLGKTASQYLPNGISPTNAVYILKERIESLQAEKKNNRLYEFRNYPVSTILTEISLIKNDIPSLRLNRFSLNENTIRFQGNTASVKDFDQLMNSLAQLFAPNLYRINAIEKNRGTASVDFSITIQEKP